MRVVVYYYDSLPYGPRVDCISQPPPYPTRNSHDSIAVLEKESVIALW